jgi:Leucine-rich repeat (LRR) protein
MFVFVQCYVCDEEIGCSINEDISSHDMEMIALGCSIANTCIIKNVQVSNETQITTNRDVREFQCLTFLNSRIYEIPSSIFSSRSNTTHLYVTDVGLVKLKRVSVLFGENLKKVSLTRNLISEIGEQIFYNSVNLRELDLSNNLLEKFSANTFEKLISLEKLDLSNNKIQNIPFELFQNLNNLVNLNISYNRLQLKFGIFPELVKILDLSYNNIDIHFKFKIFLFLDNLETLFLHGNRIENIHFSIFHMKTLKYLGISDNLFSCNMLADIFEIMKETNVTSMPQKNVHNTSNIHGIKCTE